MHWLAGMVARIVGPAVGGRLPSAILLASLLIAYLVRPEPDMDNLAWLGGLIDDPLHYSDDISRLLLVLLIVLWPGRFPASALVDLGRMIRGCRGCGALISRRAAESQGPAPLCNAVKSYRNGSLPEKPRRNQ